MVLELGHLLACVLHTFVFLLLFPPAGQSTCLQARMGNIGRESM